jgi:hypothetical protein
MSFFSRLGTKPPTPEEMDALKDCAGPKNADKRPVELAKTVIDNALAEK